MINLESTDAEIIEEMEKLRVLYTLKTTMRYRTIRPDVHSESVAEHLFAMQIVSQYFLPLEDPAGLLDRVRINELILFHELGEIETGDIVFHKKTDAQRKEERVAAGRVAARLPESLQKLTLERLDEFEANETPEATFVSAIDKIEPIFEMFDMDVARASFRRNGVLHHHAVDSKYIATETFPYMRRFLEAWEKRAVSHGLFQE